SDEVEWAVGFVSVIAVVLLAAEYLKLGVGIGPAALDASRNTFRFQFWRPEKTRPGMHMEYLAGNNRTSATSWKSSAASGSKGSSGSGRRSHRLIMNIRPLNGSRKARKAAGIL
ncbi:MAG TPA: hypothetical protein VGR18_01885, partial [Rubrobacter sp.]|nr:hypothetical protein [Rubrobacter sp.]